jgi:predicted small metal-binding protein
MKYTCIEATYDVEILKGAFTIRIWMNLSKLDEAIDGEIVPKIFAFLKKKGKESTSKEEMIEFIAKQKNVNAVQVQSKHGFYKLGKVVYTCEFDVKG